MDRIKCNKGYLIICSVLYFSLFFAQLANGQEDNRLTRKYDTGDFTELFLEGAFGVELIQGNANSLEVRAADEKAFDYLNVTNEQGRLHLHVDRKPFDFSRITLYVTFKTLSRIHIFGGIRLNTKGFLDLDDVDLLLEGGARVNFQLIASRIRVENRGGVLCEISGVTNTLDVRLAGAGHVNAKELKAEEVRFKIEGVGTGKVFATQTLRADIKGAGKIKYKGNPQVFQSIEGLGSVVRE
ncbi:MAG TPA: DUF2807 domain-containing protein [Mariniphaga anaerophila]|uniref:DUF2807 domain-containing protein n=1 Tax=Mariniphaga anaerophila TaxID=1484053 RepID=A0A831PQ10_9BACT|nr:DUF2807 domain-containing protein [Mariniphaga anaerophila]